VLAGGTSHRFGHSKVLVPLAGAPMASWGVRTLQAADLPVGVVSDDEGVEAALGVPTRPDLEAGLGPIGGLWSALQWAEERGDHGVLLIGCDMPLVSAALVRTVRSPCARCTDRPAWQRSSAGSGPRTDRCEGWWMRSGLPSSAMKRLPKWPIH
jgi:molybdopterin-guanine dinucleotide biosynthesis protein A